MINISLTEAEAKTLAFLLCHVGGCPFNSARGFTQNISRKLDNHRKQFQDEPVYLELEDTAHSIYFKDFP